MLIGGIMPKKISGEKIAHIVRLRTLNLSAREKAKIVGVKHPTISFYERRIDELQVTSELIDSLSDSDKQALFHPKISRSSKKAPIDYEEIHKKLNAPQPSKGKYLLKHACEEQKEKYGDAADCRSGFYAKIGDYRNALPQKESLYRDYQPGEAFFCDYAGPKVPYGEEDQSTANFIIGCFGNSGYLFLRATDDQKAEQWMSFIQDTFHSLKKQPYRIVHDNGPLVASAKPNLKFNKMYQAMIDHYGFIVNPTPRKSPNFNALAEISVKIFEIDILPKILRRKFKTLKELNDFIQACLAKINQRILSEDVESRADKFFRDELPAMRDLTETVYDIPLKTRVFKVPKTWSFKYEGVKYPIPHTRGLKRVTVLIRKNEIEIKRNNTTLCVHERLRSGQKHQVNPKHISKKFQKYFTEDQAHFESWASALSPAVVQLVKSQFNGISTPDFEGRAACIQLQKLAKKTTECNFIDCCDYVVSRGELSVEALRNAIKNELADPKLDQLCLLLGAQFNQPNGEHHVH